MILEEADIVEYLQKCDVDEIVKMLIDSTSTYKKEAEIVEELADHCRAELKRYKLIDDDEEA